MSETTVIFGAATLLEVQTGGGVVWGGYVGERARVAFRAVTAQPVPTRRLLFRIVDEKAPVPGTDTYPCVSIIQMDK